MAKARILASQDHLAKANEVLEVVLFAAPESGAAWDLFGDIRVRQEKPQEALAAYDKAIAIQPHNYSTLFKRALVSLQSGDFEAAQADATVLLRIAPQHPGTNYIQGLLHFQAGRYGETITALSVVEPAFKQFPLVLFFLGSAQFVEDNIDQAAVQTNHFYSIAPENIRGRKLLATIQLQQGKYAKGQTLLRPVLDADPEDLAALNLLFNALLREGKTDEGIDLLSRVAELQPDSPVAQVKLGASLLIGEAV